MFKDIFKQDKKIGYDLMYRSRMKTVPIFLIIVLLLFTAAPLLEILNGTSFIAMRAIASKLVTGDEFGKVNLLYGLAEAMTPLLYGPIYTQVYVATLNFLPGAVFLLGAALTVPSVLILGWLYFEHRKDKIINIDEEQNKQQCVEIEKRPKS